VIDVNAFAPLGLVGFVALIVLAIVWPWLARRR
jgi:hypothetical protein